VQTPESRPPSSEDQVISTFADRAKSARLGAGLTQQQLSDRLDAETPVTLDTSAITRIEAGQREPRLGEALAIAKVLSFGLNNLVPQVDLDFYLSDVERLMNESRAALVRMVKSVDPLIEFVQANPSCLGEDRIEDRIREIVAYFGESAARDELSNIAITTNRTEEKLKRQLLRAVSDGILVRTRDIQPSHEGWYKDDVGASRASTSDAPQGGWRRGEQRVRADQWERHYGQLLEYVRDHGNARVPPSHVSEDGDPLGAWVVEQRDRFARGMLDADRSSRLEKLPRWTWGPRGARSRTSGADPV
jgi:transcriptional regulator with XRE-family HTH domain